jgi:hypothetical protein
MRPELFALLPRNKFDTANAEAVVAAGYPAVEPLLPRLIEWLQDANWPVARVLAPFLAGIGAHMEPHVRQVLQTTDEIWKYWVLECMVGSSSELRLLLQPELERIAFNPTEGEAGEELNVLAQSLLHGAA